uniref:Uncharacterized protein n=1 Tax=Physcomitrium patens TaxID=3218 RepID=A0A2K1IV81_PHYPA|nr:hypothetical protein PHYPA_025125 [Physcomitrium patens]
MKRIFVPCYNFTLSESQIISMFRSVDACDILRFVIMEAKVAVTILPDTPYLLGQI